MADDEEFGRLDVELFTDILTNQNQVFATLAAGTRFGFVTNFNARQVIRQRLTAGAFAPGDRLDLGDHVGAVACVFAFGPG